MKPQVGQILILLSLFTGCSLYMDLDPISSDAGESDLNSPNLEDTGANSSEPDLPELVGQDMPESDSDSDEDMINVSPPVGWDRVFAGRNHTCALNLEGEAWCWGSGQLGELGSGAEDSTVPLKVPIDVPLVELALGAEFSCGLTATGQLHCWGTFPARIESTEPFLFDDGTWEKVKTNSYHVCGLRDGALHCFGNNQYGQLGSGVPGPSALIAVPVELEGTLVDFAVSHHQTCALIDIPDRQLWCAGTELGSELSSTAGRRQIPTTEDYAAILGSQDHFCVLTEQGEPHCFGPADHLSSLRSSGSLMEPGPFQQAHQFESISLGRSTACGFTTAGTALCWGGNRRGKLGRGSEQVSDASAQNFGFLDYAGTFRSLAIGTQHACGVSAEHEILCWGEHFPSATGTDPGYHYIPQRVVSPDTYEEVAVGLFTTCGLTDDGRVACWGRGIVGLGLNTSTHVSTPTGLGGLVATSIRGGNEFYCANAEDGLKCWGSNTYGRLGNNSSSSSGVPVDVLVDGPYQHFALGIAGACAIKPMGTATLKYCWGRRQILGYAATADSRVPVLLEEGHEDYVQMAVGDGHACGLTAAGIAYCWGENSYGQLGNNSTTFSAEAVPVSGDLVFSEIFAADDITCGLAEQIVYCWGSGVSTGVSSTSNERVPKPIDLSEPLSGVSGNRRTLCGVAENGDVYCWGANTRGQAGAPRSSRIGTPVKVGLPEPAKLVRSGDAHSCAVLLTGEIYCWGDTSFYTLGDGRFGMSLSPTPILPLP